MGVQSYQELTMWRKAMELVTEVYRATERYPKTETYGLVSQTRRAAVSIPSNIAEGWMRRHRLEYVQALNIALGSGAELETQLMIGNTLGFLSTNDLHMVNTTNTEIMKMLNTTITTLRSTHP